MSTELIRAVYVRPDGVYLNSKSNNDDRPFRDCKCDSLTDIYRNEGQRGLDREIVRMLSEYAQIQGHHASMERYQPCLRDGTAFREAFLQSVQNEYIKLTPEDIASIWFTDDKQTAGAKVYQDFRRKAENELYTKLAALADGLPYKNTRQKSDIDTIAIIRNLCGDITRPPQGDYDRNSYVQARLSQIGISAARLSDEFKDATRDEVKWGFVHALSGMIDVCDEQTTREIAELDIPTLQNFCERELEKHRGNNGHKHSNDDLSR